MRSRSKSKSRSRSRSRSKGVMWRRGRKRTCLAHGTGNADCVYLVTRLRFACAIVKRFSLVASRRPKITKTNQLEFFSGFELL